MHLRQFNFAQDYEPVLALWQAAGPGVRVGRSDQPAEILKKLARDPDLFLVAEDDQQIVGAALGGFDGRRGLVYHLAVAEAYRGCGIGSALLAELEARLRARGCLKCYLVVTHNNPEVLGFYEQQGWQVMPVYLLGKELQND